MNHALDQATGDYLLWMIEKGYAPSTWERRERILKLFCSFVKSCNMGWEDIFTQATLKAFEKECRDTFYAALSVRGLWQYLFEQGKVSRPLSLLPQLPQVFEEYLTYYAKTVLQYQIWRAREVLSGLHDYLERQNMALVAIKICDLDGFLAKYNAPYTAQGQQNNRSCLRGFLRYLYQRHILPKDFAPLLVGAPLYAQSRPPRFLRPHQIQRLFSHLKPSSAWDLRTKAFLYLAYTLGLRPREISLISMDDIFFQQGEVKIRDRKNEEPLILPLPDEAIKAIAAYIIGARPKSTERALFLRLKAPHGPISPSHVARDVNRYMRKVSLPSSCYWLRHTYAQNLLERGASIFEIKQMLGHERLQTSQHYLHIHTTLMREVLFNETI